LIHREKLFTADMSVSIVLKDLASMAISPNKRLRNEGCEISTTFQYSVSFTAVNLDSDKVTKFLSFPTLNMVDHSFFDGTDWSSVLQVDRWLPISR
jgi:hypothetical protein